MSIFAIAIDFMIYKKYFIPYVSRSLTIIEDSSQKLQDFFEQNERL